MATLKQKVGGVAKALTVYADFDDALLVHKTGTEEIAGRKDFTVSPTVPTVADTTDATTKAASTAFVQEAVKISPDADNTLEKTSNGLKVADTGGKVLAYLNRTNGKFYKEQSFTTEIVPNNKNTYIDITNDDVWVPYVWDSANSKYKRVSGYVHIEGSLGASADLDTAESLRDKYTSGAPSYEVDKYLVPASATINGTKIHGFAEITTVTNHSGNNSYVEEIFCQCQIGSSGGKWRRFGRSSERIAGEFRTRFDTIVWGAWTVIHSA